MLVDIQEACNKIGVNFALCGGSCLGAVRHQGFIPWDDDVDISIFRKDWEKFKINFKRFLGSKYILEAPDYENRDSKYPWPKIYLKGSEYIDAFDVCYPYEHGISIDVFVIENVSPCLMIRKMDSIISNFIKFVSVSILFYKHPSPIIEEAFSINIVVSCYYKLRKVLGLFCSIIPHYRWMAFYDTFISRHSDSYHFVTIPTGTKLYMGEMLPREFWLPYSKGLFCGREFNIPHQSQKYLQNLYGNNFMQIPNKDKQEYHYIVSLKFPN